MYMYVLSMRPRARDKYCHKQVLHSGNQLPCPVCLASMLEHLSSDECVES